MKEKQTDLRVVRTKHAIREAFTSLIKEKEFDAITVKDITVRANINRGTFYAHFEDKFELMATLQQEIFLNFFKILEEEFLKNNLPKEERLSREVFDLVYTRIFIFVFENRVFIKSLIRNEGTMNFSTNLKAFLWKMIIKENNHPFLKREQIPIPGEYLISYLAAAHLGIIFQWLEDDCQRPVAEMAAMMNQLTSPIMLSMANQDGLHR